MKLFGIFEKLESAARYLKNLIWPNFFQNNREAYTAFIEQ